MFVPSTALPVFRLLTPGVPGAPLFEFSSSLTLSEEYSDNFDQARTNKRDNFRTSVSPGLGLRVNGPITRGELGYVLSAAYDSSDAKGSLFHDFSGQLQYRPRPWFYVTATDNLVHSDDAFAADVLGLRGTRETFTLNNFTLEPTYLIGTLETRLNYQLSTFYQDGPDTVSHQLGVTLAAPVLTVHTVSLSYWYLTSDTSDNGTDVNGHNISVSVSRELNPTLSVGVSGNYTPQKERDGRTGAESSFDTIGGQVFGLYHVANIVSLSLSLGYSRFSAEAGEDSDAITTQSQLIYRFGKATLMLTGNVGYSQTFATGQNFGVVLTRDARGLLTYELTPLTTASVGGFYFQNDFTGVGGGQADRTDHVWGGTAGISIRLLRWLTFGLDFLHQERTSTIRTLEFTEDRGTLSMTASF